MWRHDKQTRRSSYIDSFTHQGKLDERLEKSLSINESLQSMVSLLSTEEGISVDHILEMIDESTAVLNYAVKIVTTVNDEESNAKAQLRQLKKDLKLVSEQKKETQEELTQKDEGVKIGEKSVEEVLKDYQSLQFDFEESQQMIRELDEQVFERDKIIQNMEKVGADEFGMVSREEHEQILVQLEEAKVTIDDLDEEIAEKEYQVKASYRRQIESMREAEIFRNELDELKRSKSSSEGETPKYVVNHSEELRRHFEVQLGAKDEELKTQKSQAIRDFEKLKREMTEALTLIDTQEQDLEESNDMIESLRQSNGKADDIYIEKLKSDLAGAKRLVSDLDEELAVKDEIISEIDKKKFTKISEIETSLHKLYDDKVQNRLADKEAAILILEESLQNVSAELEESKQQLAKYKCEEDSGICSTPLKGGSPLSTLDKATSSAAQSVVSIQIFNNLKKQLDGTLVLLDEQDLDLDTKERTIRDLQDKLHELCSISDDDEQMSKLTDDLSLAKDLLKEMDEEINEKTKIIKSVETEMEAIRKGKEPTRVHALSEDGDAVSRMSEDLDVAKDLIEEMDEELKEKTGMIESLKQKLEEANEHGAREQKMESERVQQRLDEKQFAIAIMEESVEKMSLDLERAQQQVKSEQRRGLKRANDLQAKLYEKDGVIGTMINMIESLQKEVISLEKEKKREDFGGKPNYSLGTASKASSRGFFKNLAGAALGSFSESIQYELDQATATIEKNKEQVDMLVEQLEEKTSQIASLKKQLEEAEKARKRSKSPKRGLATKQEKVPNADNDNVELIRSLETRAENAQSELKRMQKDFDDLAEELAEKESEMRDLQAKLEIATKALEDGYRDKNDSESEAEMKKLQLLLAEKEAVIRTLNDTLETANQSLQKNKESINRYIKIESDLTEKLAQLESRLSENENRHIEKEFDLARKLELAQRSVSEKEATIKSLQEMIEKESKSTYSDEKKEVSIRTLEVKVASIQTDFDGLADELSEKKEENRSLGTELEVVKKARTDIESDKMQLEETQSKLKKTKTLLAEKELTAKLMRNKLNDYKEDVEKHAITLSELEKVKALLTQKESMMESLTENVNEANRILGEHEAALCMHRAAELEFSEKLEELQESLVRKDDAIYSLETTQEDKSALEENKYDLCKSLQEQVDESHRKLRIIREDYNKLGNESQRLATKFKAMSSEALETFKQFADIQSKLEKGKAALEIEESMEGASTELAKKQGDVGALERKLQSLINTNKDLVEKDAWVETDLSVKLNKIQTLESSLVNAQASLEMRQEDIELELKEKCTEYENTIESLKQQLQDAKYLSNDTHDNFDMQVNQFDQNDSHIESLQKEVEQTSAALRAQEVQMIDQKMAATKSEETANSEILALRIEIESLGNELSEKDSQIQAIRNQSKEKRQNKIWKTERVSDQSPKSDSTETDIPPSIEQAFIDAENSFEMEEAALDALASELAEKDYTRLVESLESELCASKAQLKDMITLSDALSTDLRLKDDQLEVVKKQGIGLHQNLAAKEDQLQLMHAKTESIVSGLNDQLDEFRCEVDLIKTEKKELEKKIETTKQERVVSVAESKLIEEEHEKLKDKSALLEKEKLSLETSLAMLTTGAIAKESKERELHSSLSEAKNTINALTQRLGEQVSLMIAEKQKHLSEKEAVYEEMTKSSSALESAEFEVIKLNRKFELAKEEKSLMESQCHRVEKDKLLLSEKVKELQTALKKEKAVMIDLQDQATQAKASAIATEEELQNQIEHLSERFKMIEGLGEEVERATVQFQKTNEKKDSRIIQLETQYTKTLDSLKDREKDIERQDERLIQLLSEKEMYVSDHQEATTKLEAQLVDAQHQSALFKLEKKNAIGVIEEIRAEKMELAEHCKALELNIESLTEQIAKLKFETETLVVGTDDLTQSLGDARKEVESLELEIKIVTRESDEKVQELQSLHHEINEFILRISEKNKEIEELEQQHLDEKVLLNDQVRQKNSKIQALGFELKSEKEDLEMKNEEIKLLISKLDALENTSLSESLDQRYIIETLKRRLDYASEQRNELEEKNKSEILAKQLEQKDTLVAKLKSDNAKMTLNDEIIKSLEVKLRDVTGNFKQAGKKQAELESSLQEKEGTIQALQKNRRNTSRIIYELKETNKKQAEDAASATLRQRVTNRHQIRRTTDGTTTNKNLAFDGYMESFTIDVNKARAQYEKARKTLKMAIARERLVRPL